MKKTFLIINFLIFINCCYSQRAEISRIISDSLENIELEARLNRIALSSNYFKANDRIRINSSFEIDDFGRLKNIKVRAPLPRIETTISFVLKSIIIPIDLLESFKDSRSQMLFALPIFYHVKSESDMIQIINKEKRKKKRELKKQDRRKKSKSN